MSISPTKRWHIHKPAPDLFLNSVSDHPLLAQVLYNRGLRDPDEVSAFLRMDDAVIENPYRLQDMVPAVTRILQAIEQEETVCVYGDFDADGVTATALLVNALQVCGARVGRYIPNRVDEGYGLNVDALERLATGADLLITVDCGIRSVTEVQHAIALGMDIIVTDHHSVGPELPPALAVINPRRQDDSSTFDSLAGVGVAYRLAQAVIRAVSQQRNSPISPDEGIELEEQLLDLVAIGTVADIMPLNGDNRSLVQRGLIQLNQTQRLGLQTLFTTADLRPGHIIASDIGFKLGPRINAAGRLGESSVAYDLLRTSDPADAYNYAARLEALNQERRLLTTESLLEAEQQLTEQVTDDPAMVLVASDRFQPGIVGLVAGKLCDRFYRPAVVIEMGETLARGSARSIAEWDISAALDNVSELLVRHGGHRRAAGFTVEIERLPEFSEALQSAAKRDLAVYDDLRPSLDIDAEVSYELLNWALAEQFARLEPMGQGNPQPLLMVRGLRVHEARGVGQGKHLKLSVDNGGHSHALDAIAFGQGDRGKILQRDDRIDAVFSLEVNVWRQRKRLQLNVQDFCTSES